MYVKDMPSVAANSACRNEGLDSSRIGDDLVLDGVIDDRIAAAYAIVELGERDSRKGAEFASSELDEELEVDDLDQYHQVPRSPEYCRKDRRCEYDNRGSSADSSPVRTVGRSPVESQSTPRVGHVKWAVMPSRTTGKPEPKLHPKRRVDEEGGNGIKAKLARMLFEKKVSRTDDALEMSPQDDERETGMKYKGAVDSDEERPVESQGGRFVRTSVPLIEPVNVVSCAQSPARCEQQRNRHENLETRLEQSYSAEEINRFRESLLGKQSDEESAQSRGLRQNASSAAYGVSPIPVCSASSASPIIANRRFEVEPSAKDLVIPTHSTPSSPAFPNTPEGEQNLSSHDVDVPKFSQFPPPTTGASEYFVRETAPLVNMPPSWSPYLFLGQTGGSVLNPSAQIGNVSEGYEPRVVKTVVPGTGFVQYFVLPAAKTTPNSVNRVSSADYLKANAPVEVKQDVDDAMTKLERFTLGNQLYGGSPSRPELILSDTGMPYWCVAPQAKSFYPRFGSLSSISNYYGGPASSDTGLYPSNSAVSRSCHDLTRIPSKSPKFQGAPEDLPRRPSPDLKCRRPKSNESAQRGSTKRGQRVCKDRRRILPAAYAREKVRGGEFGSLTAIRRYYDSLKSRSAPNLYEQSPKKMQFVELRERAGSLSQNYVEVAQDSPLDLSSYRRKLSAEQRIDVKPCPSELQSFSISEISVPAGVNADSSRPWLQDSHAQIGSIERPDICLDSQQQKANIPKDSCDVELAVEKSSNPSLSHSLSNNLPNSSLPPKKRKLRQPSQGRDFSEVRTATSTKSVGSTMTYLRQADCKPDSSAAKQSQDSSEVLDTHRQFSAIVSHTETGFVLTPEMKLLENKVGVRDEDGDLPLHIAVAKGYLEFVQKVLLPMMSQHGVHIDSCNHQRQTALHLAVITNQPQMVETLLNASASASVCDRKGNTAVHLAIKYKTHACLRYILTSSRKRLDLDAKNYEGLTALHVGVQLSEREAVNALLVSGADPNAMDGTNGRTPLFYAVETNDYLMASILLKHGSDPCIASYSGCTPLQIATAKSFRDMTNMLERSFPRGFADEEESFRQHT